MVMAIIIQLHKNSLTILEIFILNNYYAVTVTVLHNGNAASLYNNGNFVGLIG